MTLCNVKGVACGDYRRQNYHQSLQLFQLLGALKGQNHGPLEPTDISIDLQCNTVQPSNIQLQMQHTAVKMCV